MKTTDGIVSPVVPDRSLEGIRLRVQTEIKGAAVFSSRELPASWGPLQTEWSSPSDVIHALAETHAELVLIHPFRDGNGRLARVLSSLMALQAGLPLLDFSGMAGTGKTAYIAAIQAALDKHHAPMEYVFGEVIEQSRSSS
jgi:cell filamentation protein